MEELESELVTAIESFLGKIDEKVTIEPPFEPDTLISSVDELKQNSAKFKCILEDEKIHSELQQEFNSLCNWFQVNEITVEDLSVEDPESTPNKISLDMDIEQMRAELLKYMKPIISTGFEGLKTAPGVTHVIELVDQKPFREKYRAVPHSKRADFNKLLNELVHHKIIVESKSPYSSPPHVLLKPDGSIRFTVDYKRLNSLTIKDNYPLPVIDDLFKDMIGCKLNWASNHVKTQRSHAK
jgi:hypothetical protein